MSTTLRALTLVAMLTLARPVLADCEINFDPEAVDFFSPAP